MSKINLVPMIEACVSSSGDYSAFVVAEDSTQPIIATSYSSLCKVLQNKVSKVLY